MTLDYFDSPCQDPPLEPESCMKKSLLNIIAVLGALSPLAANAVAAESVVVWDTSFTERLMSALSSTHDSNIQTSHPSVNSTQVSVSISGQSITCLDGFQKLLNSGWRSCTGSNG